MGRKIIEKNREKKLRISLNIALVQRINIFNNKKIARKNFKEKKSYQTKLKPNFIYSECIIYNHTNQLVETQLILFIGFQFNINRYYCI